MSALVRVEGLCVWEETRTDPGHWQSWLSRSAKPGSQMKTSWVRVHKPGAQAKRIADPDILGSAIGARDKSGDREDS